MPSHDHSSTDSHYQSTPILEGSSSGNLQERIQSKRQLEGDPDIDVAPGVREGVAGWSGTQESSPSSFLLKVSKLPFSAFNQEGKELNSLAPSHTKDLSFRFLSCTELSVRGGSVGTLILIPPFPSLA